MKQRIADALQLLGAAAFGAAGYTVNTTVGLVSTAIALVVAGVVVESS